MTSIEAQRARIHEADEIAAFLIANRERDDLLIGRSLVESKIAEVRMALLDKKDYCKAWNEAMKSD